MLAEKYRRAGFEIKPFGASSTALKRYGKVVFVFNPGIREEPRFVDALCECNLKLNEGETLSDTIPANSRLSLAGLLA